MKQTDHRTKTLEELKGMVETKKLELAKLRFKQTIGQLEKNAELRKAKREIARIKTIAREKEIKNAKAN